MLARFVAHGYDLLGDRVLYSATHDRHITITEPNDDGLTGLLLRVGHINSQARSCPKCLGMVPILDPSKYIERGTEVPLPE